jgi:rod shape-determining protein MreD
MNRGALRFIFTAIAILLFQVLILNNIQFSGFINPYIYVMIIMLLPVEMAQWIVLLISFGVGLIMDSSAGTPGMHTSATVLAGFVRPHLLSYISPSDGYQQGEWPSMYIYGARWFAAYAMWMLLVHHTAFFFIEVFKFQDFFRTLIRVVFSTTFSLIFVVVAEYYRRLK